MEYVRALADRESQTSWPIVALGLTMRLVSVTLLLAQVGLIIAAKGDKKRKSGNNDKSQQYIKIDDCGMDPDRPVRFLNVNVTPRIIRYPGKIKVSTDANVTETLPETLSADVIISKYIWGSFIKIPCVKNMGSCHYKQLCELLDAYYGRRCPRRLRRQNLVSCHCPFQDGLYTLKNLRFDVPAIDGMWAFWVSGQYEVMIRLYNETNNDELACLKFTFFMKEKTRGKHRRRRRHKPHPLTPE